MHLRSNRIKPERVEQEVTKVKQIHVREEIEEDDGEFDEVTFLHEELLGCDDWDDEAKKAYTIAYKKIKALPAFPCPPRIAGVWNIRPDAVPAVNPGTLLATFICMPANVTSVRIVPNTIITDSTGCTIDFIAEQQNYKKNSFLANFLPAE